jgi:hypothetical protein
MPIFVGSGSDGNPFVVIRSGSLDISSSAGRSSLSGTFWTLSGSGGYANFRTGSARFQSGSASSALTLSGSQSTHSGAFGTTVYGSSSMSASRSPAAGGLFGRFRWKGNISGSSLTGRYSGSYSGFVTPISSRPLLYEDSGQTFLLGKNDKVMTLPSPDQAGIYYKFIARQNFQTNNSGVRSAAAADYIYGTAVASDGGNISSSYTPSNNFCSFTTGSKVGDSFVVISNGSAWMVTGQCHSGSIAPSSNAEGGKLAGITFHH